MEYISSDTNIWIDFATIKKVELPFLLPYTYLMNNDAVETEFQEPINLKENLLKLGLKSIEINLDEYSLATNYAKQYKQLSVHDRIALAIAKYRNITLLTGDRHLRIAATKESVNVIGTIGILDKLFIYQYISNEEYIDCINKLIKHNGNKVRLPAEELRIRLTIEKREQLKTISKFATIQPEEK